VSSYGLRPIQCGRTESYRFDGIVQWTIQSPIYRSQCGQNSFTENGSEVRVQHALIILEGFRAHSRSYGRLKPSVKLFVQRYLGPFQIADQVTLSQFYF
jgi:hypothetical protein